MNYLINKRDVYEITCMRSENDFQRDAEVFVVTIKQDVAVVSKVLVRISYELLMENPMSEHDKLNYSMKKAGQMAKVRDKLQETVIVTTNFESLKGKIVNDDEIDQKLVLLIGRFFRKYSGPVIKRLSPDDLFISTDFNYQSIVDSLGYFVKRGVIKYSSLSGDEYELEKRGFEMIEKLQQSSKVSTLPENRYFQLVSLSKKVKEPFVFVLMPFKPQEFDQKVYSDVIKPTVKKELGICCIRSDEETKPGVINNQIFTMILKAKLIIAETTSKNPNVFYEVGMAHAFNKDVFIFNNSSNKELPFDISTIRAVFYDDYEDLKEKIVENLKDHVS